MALLQRGLALILDMICTAFPGLHRIGIVGQRGQALIIDICSIRGEITKLCRSANVLVGLAGMGVVCAAKT